MHPYDIQDHDEAPAGTQLAKPPPRIRYICWLRHGGTENAHAGLSHTLAAVPGIQQACVHERAGDIYRTRRTPRRSTHAEAEDLRGKRCRRVTECAGQECGHWWHDSLAETSALVSGISGPSSPRSAKSHRHIATLNNARRGDQQVASAPAAASQHAEKHAKEPNGLAKECVRKIPCALQAGAQAPGLLTPEGEPSAHD